MSKGVLWKYHVDCGRMRNIDGVFIASEEEVKGVIGKTIYLGEALGKHSEVTVIVEEKEITKLTDNETVVDVLLDACGGTVSGYNPVGIYADQKEYDE